MTKQQAYHQRKPWAKHVSWARRRCTDRKHHAFASHGAKGITCPLTVDEAERLWKRDQAHLLRRPSLDRRESDKHYTFDNCRFIEHNLNARLPHDASLRAEDLGDPSWAHEDVPAWVTER